MKPTLVVGAFLAAVLIASPVLAKQGDPIPGTVVGIEHDPESVVVSQTKTNSAGVAEFQNVKPGKYRLTIGTIDWGDGSTTRGPISEKSTAVIEINVPGQAKIADNESPRPDDRSMKTADQHVVPFTVTGNDVRTVTVTITRGAGSK
jgi:hypothetical protein